MQEVGIPVFIVVRCIAALERLGQSMNNTYIHTYMSGLEHIDKARNSLHCISIGLEHIGEARNSL
jgi:hypothetical protein